MSRTDRQYRFRPPPELAAQLNAYCLRERRRSVNEALIVLVSMALEHDREARARLDSKATTSSAGGSRLPGHLGASSAGGDAHEGVTWMTNVEG